jgi:hypothetical protein
MTVGTGSCFEFVEREFLADGPDISHRNECWVPHVPVLHVGPLTSVFTGNLNRINLHKTKAGGPKRNKVQIAVPIVALRILWHDRPNPIAHV